MALTQLPELVPGQLPRLGSLDLTHSIVEALPTSWCCHLQVGRQGRAGTAGPGTGGWDAQRQEGQCRGQDWQTLLDLASKCCRHSHRFHHGSILLHLQSLTRLVLNGAALAGGRLPPEIAALHSLRSLELRACRLAALPACVASLPGLTSLDLGVNRLADLPGELPLGGCMLLLVFHPSTASCRLLCMSSAGMPRAGGGSARSLSNGFSALHCAMPALPTSYHLTCPAHAHYHPQTAHTCSACATCRCAATRCTPCRLPWPAPHSWRHSTAARTRGELWLVGG